MPPEESIPTLSNPQSVRRATCHRTVETDLAGHRIEIEKHTFCDNPWNKQELTYRITGHPEKICAEDTAEAVAAAFALWKKVLPDMIFTPVDDADTPVDLRIVFYLDEKHEEGNDFVFTGADQAGKIILGHAFLPIPASAVPPGVLTLEDQVTWEALMGDIHLNLHVDWKKRDADDFDKEQDFDLIAVLAHEIGHALGLDHLSDPNALMAEEYSGCIEEIDTATRETIQALYAGTKPLTVSYLLLPDGGGSGSKRVVNYSSLGIRDSRITTL